MPKPAVLAASTPRRRRWKIAEARSVLAALAASGLSLPAFAMQKGIEPQRLRRWQRRLGREVGRLRGAAGRARPAAPAPAVIELRPAPRPSLRAGEAIEVVLGSGVTVRVAEAIDPAVLAQVVAALRGC